MDRDGLPAAYAGQRDSVHVVNEGATASCDAGKTACPRVGMGAGMGDPGLSGRDGADAQRWRLGESTLAFYFPQTRDGAVLLANGANGMKVMLQVIPLLFPETQLAENARSYE